MEQQESQVDYASSFVRKFIRALPWKIVFMIVLLIYLVGAKRNVKAKTDFAFERFARQFRALMLNPALLDPGLIAGVKDTFNNVTDYVIEPGKDNASQSVAGPYIEEDMKKATGY